MDFKTASYEELQEYVLLLSAITHGIARMAEATKSNSVGESMCEVIDWLGDKAEPAVAEIKARREAGERLVGG